jgi:hypothetical protein
MGLVVYRSELCTFPESPGRQASDESDEETARRSHDSSCRSALSRRVPQRSLFPSEARQLPPRFDNAFDPAPAYTCRRMGFFERSISPCRGVALLSLSINAIPGGVEPSCHTATVV